MAASTLPRQPWQGKVVGVAVGKLCSGSEVQRLRAQKLQLLWQRMALHGKRVEAWISRDIGDPGRVIQHFLNRNDTPSCGDLWNILDQSVGYRELTPFWSPRIKTAVNCLVLEPRVNSVSGVFGICHSRLAKP